MGLYNTYWTDTGEQIQLKNGDPTFRYFKIGDVSDLEDGIYFTPYGCVVIYNQVYVASFSSQQAFMWNKWDGKIEYPEI